MQVELGSSRVREGAPQHKQRETGRSSGDAWRGTLSHGYDREDNTRIKSHSSLACLSGRGVPNELAKEGCPAKPPEDLLPVGNVAAEMYQKEVRSALKGEFIFGCNPFPSEEAQPWTESEFSLHFDLMSLHQNVGHNNYGALREAVRSLIEISRRCVCDLLQ